MTRKNAATPAKRRRIPCPACGAWSRTCRSRRRCPACGARIVKVLARATPISCPERAANIEMYMYRAARGAPLFDRVPYAKE